MRAISSNWNLRVSRNCACSGEMEIGVYVIPSSRMATLFARLLPPNPASQEERIFSGSLTVPGIERTPEGFAPFLKKDAPYSSVAMAMPIEFFAIAMGE